MMPKKARDGINTGGLLAYLYGPGKRDEHVDPHMVAAWDPGVRDPGHIPEFSIADLALLMDAPVRALMGKKPRKHVYHVAVRNAPEDPALTDQQWAEVAREMMAAAGIAPRGDDRGCRWVAIRHADDHIHIVATKARQDGRQPNLRQDIVKMHAAARHFEGVWGLRRLVTGDRTATRWPRTGEVEKAARRRLPEPVRKTLQRAVREAAAMATSDADFFGRLGAAGLRVQRRIAPDGDVCGYSVALPGDRDGASRAVWFPGSKLAWDLSLPRVRERWLPDPATAPAMPPERAWQEAEQRVRQAAALLGAGGQARGAGDVAALADLLTVAALTAPGLVREELRAAAAEFERAGRAPGVRELEGEARWLYRSSAQALSTAAWQSGRNDVAAMLGLVVALTESVVAAQRWHEAQGVRAQAESARRAGRLLRQAVEVTTGSAAVGGPQRARVQRGVERTSRARAAARRGAEAAGGGGPGMAAVVRRAVPRHAAVVLADPAWPALREQLVVVEAAGGNPGKVLAAVAGQRELATADSVAEVLCWRLDGWSRGKGGADAGGARAAARPSRAGSSPGSGRSAGRPSAPGKNQSKGGPRRIR